MVLYLADLADLFKHNHLQNLLNLRELFIQLKIEIIFGIVITNIRNYFSNMLNIIR